LSGPHTPTAAAVIVGDEVLSGKVDDLNTPILARALRRAGVALRGVEVVPDEAGPLIAALQRALDRGEHVFTSGGIGPTHDDITVGCVGEAMGRPLARHAEMEAVLRRLYGERFKEAHLRMAELPEGARLWTDGSLRMPVVCVERVYILPGVPSLFREKSEWIARQLSTDPFYAYEVCCLCGEGTLAPILSQLQAAAPGVSIGSYPRFNDRFRVKVVIESKDAAAAEGVYVALRGALADDAIFSHGRLGADLD